MRRTLHISWMTILMALVAFVAKAEDETLVFGTLFTNGDEVSTVNATNFSVSFNKGTNSNTPKYYSEGAAVRVYGGGYFTVSSDYAITQIDVTFGLNDKTNKITTDVGYYNESNVSGKLGVCSQLPDNTKSVTFSVGGSSGHRRIKEIKVTYTAAASNTVATPTFNPVAGEVAKGTVVNFNCETEGVTYYYTTDGTDPTTSSSTGSSYTVNSDVTLKVMATKEGMDNSAVATAAYTVAKANPNLAFSQTNVTANYSEQFTPPTLTYDEGYDGTITYSSSNSAITVDAETGEVTFGPSAIDKTTTITATASATDNYSSATASYVLNVIDPNAIKGNLNNSTFGTSYTGSITPIANFTSVTGSIGGVTVTYAKGTASNAYINDNEIRMYNGIELKFIAPAGYTLSSLDFDNTITRCTPTSGSVSGSTWTAPSDGEVTEVTLTCSGTGNLTLKTVTIHLANSSALAQPTINPASGTYTEAQTVTITNNEEGATVYYTTDGSTPTTSSTVYSAPFTLGHSGTYTVKAIAVKGEETSNVTTNTIVINIHVDAPVFTEASGSTFTEPYTIHLTAEEGLTIYYATGADSPVDGNRQLSGSAIQYKGGIANLSKATTITAVAVDQNGNASETVIASYNYNGTVETPYYENFDQGLGNFTVEKTGSNPPEWIFRTSTGDYGERRYAYVNGSKKSGSARLVSPVIDLTDVEEATLNFIHAGRYFDGYGHTNDLSAEETAAGQAPTHAQLFVREEGGEWQPLTIPNWFTQAGSSAAQADIYARSNSGDISLDAYKGKKVQVSFLYTADSQSTGIWNVLKFALTTTSVEVVNMKTDGYVTYVVKNDIDWAQTLEKNTADESVNVHGYKVVQFTQETAVFVEYGVGENETLIPAETPIIMKGKAGDNHLVIARSENVIEKPVGNLLKPSYGDVTAAAGQHLMVFQKESNWSADDPYNNYAFFKLKEGRLIPDRKSYLNGADVSEEITYTTNAAEGVFLLEDLGNAELATTAIEDIEKLDTSWFAQGDVYDLSGRKLADSIQSMPSLSKGIYIVNGRKVVIK